MKRKNKKLLTMILASTLCAATVGGLFSLGKVNVSAADAGSYELSDVFSVTDATLACNESKTTTFAFEKSGVANLKRNLAFKWYKDGNAKFLTVKFTFENLNFDKVEFAVESASAWATEDDKTKNTVVFTNKNGTVYAQVNDGDEKVTSIQAGSETELALAEGVEDGQFDVKLAGDVVGSFENIGENYAKYSYEKMNPLQISVTMPTKEEDAQAEDVESFILALNEINGQSFGDITEENSKYYVKDTAAPVLVVNEKLGGFLLGTKFTINYEKVDVLQSSNLTSETLYYQWNPEKEEVTDKDYVKPKSSDLYFFATPYGQESKTTVFEKFGAEYVSLKIVLGDKVFKNGKDESENAKVEYDLAWYANKASIETKDSISYIKMDLNEEGAKYSHLTANAETKTNEIAEDKAEAYKESLEQFQKALEKKAEDVYAGSNSNITLPSVKWLLDDNNGFRNLNFIISYKTPNSETAQATSNLAYSSLKFPVKYEGFYEFKVYANDKAGNNMKYYLDGEEVSVTSNNIWDIEEIPSFRFEIKHKGLKATEPTIKAKETVGDSYTFSDVTVVGATNLKENYALYKIDETKAEQIGLTATVLSKVSYADLKAELAKELTQLKDNYLDLYLSIYQELLLKKLDNKAITIEQVKACFSEINEFDENIKEDIHETEWKAHNQYNWSVSSQRFTVAESGTYVIMADYWESELPLERVAAYRVIEADSEKEIQKDTPDWMDWVKTNVVSVILFAIAGVMLILIIILLLIKPSDETLEDVDEKAGKKDKKDKK